MPRGGKIKYNRKEIVRLLKASGNMVSQVHREMKTIGRSTLYQIAHECGIQPSWRHNPIKK